MDARLLVTLTGLGLLGFLFYPRADPPPTPGAAEYVTTAREAEGEPVRLAGVQRPNPPVHTYDLGFVYRVDRMELLFANASENGPKLYEVLASAEREGPYRRIFTFHGSSRAYPYTVAIPRQPRGAVGATGCRRLVQRETWRRIAPSRPRVPTRLEPRPVRVDIP